MGKILEILTHAVLPNRCMFCGVPVEYDQLRCSECDSSAPRTDPAVCLVCGERECVCSVEENGFLRLAAPFYYEGGAAEGIRSMKFEGNLSNARKFAQDMAQSLLDYGIFTPDAVTFVPMLDKQRRRREYNSAEELARRLARFLDLPLWDLLEKTKETASQHSLTAQERKINLRGAYTGKAERRLAGETLLLVDDVYTTGATARECAKALLAAGAGSVFCTAAARTRRRKEKENHDGNT
jgi:competence protein ComFC